MTLKTLILTSTILFLHTFCVVHVFCENYAISATCHNDEWSGKNFLKNVAHQCTCEPYNEEDLKDKKSLVFFEVISHLCEKIVALLWHNGRAIASRLDGFESFKAAKSDKAIKGWKETCFKLLYGFSHK